MVGQSILAFSKSEPLFQDNFCSIDFFSVKKVQKKFVDISLESAWPYCLFINWLEIIWELHEWCAPLLLLFRDSNRFLSAPFVRMILSLQEEIRKGSSMAIRKLLGWTFHIKKPIDNILKTSEMVPSILAFSNFEPLFQRNFCSDEFFSTKRDKKTLVDGSLIAYFVFLFVYIKSPRRRVGLLFEMQSKNRSYSRKTCSHWSEQQFICTHLTVDIIYSHSASASRRRKKNLEI